jgi:hypothetical protein
MRQALTVLLCMALAAPAAAQDDVLRHGFLSPPDVARPWVYWVWMDGNVTQEGLTADLEAMRGAGIGGAIIMEVNVGIPRGPVEFMSPEWRRLFRHAVREAERCGLEITLITGPGWTGSGGPWVSPKQSMQHIVASATEVAGPRRLDTVLARPHRRRAFFGDGLLPPDLERAKNEFYRDVAVVAFPTPVGEYRIADIDEKALYVRAPYSSQPGVRPFFPSVSGSPTLPSGAAIAPTSVVDLSRRLTERGSLRWDVPAGNWTILRFGRTSTGANTRPAPVPGLGLECDKLDTSALNTHFEAFMGRLLRDLGPRPAHPSSGWTTIHIDSWEMGAQNWTDAFRGEFQSRRGYDLLRYLPAFTGRIVESIDVTERFLWDVRQTAQEMVIENHAMHLKTLARRNGLSLSIEPYDMTPCADLSLGAIADVPMCEFWLYGFNTAFSVLEATSVAHTNGRTIVAAEAFTSGKEEAWQAHPATMKGLGDWAFTAGVNRFVFHRYQHQPWPHLRPGITMGPYGVHWERTQTWWEMVPAYHSYLSRCQWVLRQGLSVADVCFLVAEGAPHVFGPPPSAVRGDPPDRVGYNFDGCAPEVLVTRMSVKDGKLVLPDGMSYRVLVLPESETMTPTLLRKVRELVERGATVIGPRPHSSPSLSGYPSCDTEVRSIAADVWGDCNGLTITDHTFGKGRVVWRCAAIPPSSEKTEIATAPDQYGDFAVVVGELERMGVAPDFTSDVPLRWTHRRDGGTDIYFVANPEGRVLSATCSFRVDGRLPELWDAVRGNMRDLPEFTARDGRTSLGIRFEPYQSFFVVFQKAADGGTRGGRNFPVMLDAGELGGPWEVTFDTAWGAPGKVTFRNLTDWTLSDEGGIKYYSGTATYRTMFDLPAVQGVQPKISDAGSGLWLDLGLVRNIARVRLNGHHLGVVWCSPWRVDVGDVIASRGNSLEIEVANLWPNRLIGDEQPDAEYGEDGNLIRWPEWLLKGLPRPPVRRYTFTSWRHFTKNTPLLQSGLIGPVRLLRSDR